MSGWSGTLRFVGWVRRFGGAVNDWIGLTATDEDEPRLRTQVGPDAILTKSILLDASGNTLIVAPTSGKFLRLYWYSYSAHPDSTDHPVASLRFGESGTLFGSQHLSKYGALFAHSFKAGASYVDGAVDEAIFGNLDIAQDVLFNIDYEEITP